MNLTPEQVQAIQKGEPVPVTVGHTECVLVRKDRFRKMQSPPYDDSEWSEGEMTQLAQQMFDDLDHAKKMP